MLVSILKDQAQREADYREEKFANNPKIRRCQKEMHRIKKCGNELETLEKYNENSINFLKHMAYHNKQMQGRTQRIVEELEYEAKFGHLLGNNEGGQQNGVTVTSMAIAA